MYSDPSGEVIVAMIIGAFINIAVQGISGNINSLGDFLLAGAIGALSGLAGAGLANLAVGASFFSTATINAVGFSMGVTVGAATGLGAGFVGGAGNAWMNGASFGEGLAMGIKAGIMGAFTGAAVGGVMGGVKAHKQGFDFWSGDKIPEPTLQKFVPLKYGRSGGGESIFEEGDAFWKPTGNMEFRDLTQEQLEYFRIIPEDGGSLITPTANHTSYGDGFYYDPQHITSPEKGMYWYKVSGGSRVVINTTESGAIRFTPYVNQKWNSIFQFAGRPYHVSFRPFIDGGNWHNSFNNPFRDFFNLK